MHYIFILFKITIVTTNLVQSTCGHLNLYLSLLEVQRLFGVYAELFYIREGIVNENALKFIVPVPLKVDTLHLTWESQTGRPLPYVIEVKTPDSAALITPKLNISTTGLIPTSPQTFSLTLLCSGVATTDLNVFIRLNITTPGNTTYLTLSRKKTCYTDSPSSLPTSPDISNSVVYFYIAIGCLSLLVLLLTFLTIFSRCRNNKCKKEETTVPTTQTNQPETYGSFRCMPSYSLIEQRSKDLQDRIADLTVQRYRVKLSNVVLEGTFGRVYHGSYQNEKGGTEDVLIKTVADHATQVQISLLLQEGMSMYSLTHKNILSILGVSIEDQTAPYLLYPYNNYSNLKVFLQKCKLSSEGISHTLTTQEVVDMALQVVHAMQYLHKKHFLHKDLAARNCVVTDKLKVQVADNALSRDLFPSDYHCLGDNENRPIKWLAIESLQHKMFSPSSDVWSFGVLLWELTTLAQQPYMEVDPFEMAVYLKDGYRLSQPINCPDELFAVMAYCWAMSPDERPTFIQLQVCLKEFYAQLAKYV